MSYYFFWRGPFSNWHKANFWDRGVKYSCVEQYMMAHKAMMFGDKKAYDKIMHEDSPRTMKAIGREVKDFDRDRWDFFCDNIVFRACLCKFTEHADLHEELLRTGDSILVEASPYDRIWGIGYGESEAMYNRADWGENKLGNILTEIKTLLWTE